MNIKLADGKEYEIQPLTLGALERLQPLITRVYGVNNDVDVTNPVIFSDVISICVEILKKTIPDITADQTKELVDIKNIKDVLMVAFGAEQTNA